MLHSVFRAQRQQEQEEDLEQKERDSYVQFQEILCGGNGDAAKRLLPRAPPTALYPSLLLKTKFSIAFDVTFWLTDFAIPGTHPSIRKQHCGIFWPA